MRLYVFDPLIINVCSLRIELIYNDSSFISLKKNADMLRKGTL